MKDSKDEEEVIVLVKVKFGRKVRVVGISFYYLDVPFYTTQCLKIPKKVSFNVASEASYFYSSLQIPNMGLNSVTRQVTYKKDKN